VNSIASLPAGEPEPEGPSLAELAAIEAEWPVIEAEMALVDAEIAVLTGPGRKPTDLEWQRLRAAERDVVAAWIVFAARWGRGRAVA
jgi:hypothetical protein